MSRFECVPNFSEGRNEATIERIVRAAGSVAGVSVLDVERNADHHRSVVTLVGEGSALVEGVLAAMRVATELIDLNHHRGEHPRIGADGGGGRVGPAAGRPRGPGAGHPGLPLRSGRPETRAGRSGPGAGGSV